MPSHTQLACSFCGKGAEEVANLVAGPEVYICDTCVATASRIMSAADDTGPQTPLPSHTPWQWLNDSLSRIRSWWQESRSQRTALTHQPTAI